MATIRPIEAGVPPVNPVATVDGVIVIIVLAMLLVVVLRFLVRPLRRLASPDK
jgi:hypothetical protein